MLPIIENKESKKDKQTKPGTVPVEI